MDLFENRNIETQHEKTWPQVLAILISSLSGITNGLLFSWPSPFFVKITQDKDNYDISEEDGSYFNTVQSIAMVLTSPIFSKLCNIIGRKNTLLLSSVPQVASWLCAGFAKSVYVFYTARALAGVSYACYYAALPIYVGEISTPAIRGTWGNLLSTSYYFGEFFINIIGSYCGVRETSYICLPLPILFFCLFSLMPESPYYYVMKGEEKNARQSLMFFKRTTNIEDSFIQLKADVKRQMSETSSWTDVMKINSNRKAVLAGTFLRFSQQMSGFQIFTTYTQFIFQKSGGNFSREFSAILYTGLLMCLNVLALIFIVHRFGRRVCFIMSISSTAVILYAMGTYFYIDENTDMDLSRFKWFPITSMVIFEILASFGIAITPTLMLSELFSISIKAKGIMMTQFASCLGSVVNNSIFYYVNSLVGFYAPFYVFAISNTAAAILSYYIIPETKDKTLEEIQQSLKK